MTARVMELIKVQVNPEPSDPTDPLLKELDLHVGFGMKLKIRIPMEAKLQGLEEKVMENVVQQAKEKLAEAIKEACIDQNAPVILTRV